MERGRGIPKIVGWRRSSLANQKQRPKEGIPEGGPIPKHRDATTTPLILLIQILIILIYLSTRSPTAFCLRTRAACRRNPAPTRCHIYIYYDLDSLYTRGGPVNTRLPLPQYCVTINRSHADRTHRQRKHPRHRHTHAHDKTPKRTPPTST